MGARRDEGSPEGSLRAGLTGMLKTLLQQLAARFLRLEEEASGRPGTAISALLVSLTIHAMVLVGLAFAGHQVQEVVQREFTSEVGSQPMDFLETDSTFQDLDQDETPPVLEASGSFAPLLATTVRPGSSSSAPITMADASEAEMFDFGKLDVQRATETIAPSATILGKSVFIQGSGAEHVEGVDGAVDRVAIEILRRLENGRTLVVWAFDASRSLEAERKRLSAHIAAIYEHIRQLDQNRLSLDGGLLTMVVAFGQNRSAAFPKPTEDISVIRNAIDAVKPDESGIETTFTTVGEIVGRWGRFKNDAGDPYNLVVIVVTDEVGDDEERLEETIALARKREVPVYVLGSEAVFGRVDGYVDYYDPKTKHTFKNVPVRQGPESAMLERLQLPFWYEGPQYDVIQAGFGPYALSRMASATGGIYFVTRFEGRRMGFDASKMKEYRPDWSSSAEYQKGIVDSPVRQAVLNAALLTQQKLPGMPTLNFPSLEAPNFKNVLRDNQAIADRIAYTVDEALGPITAAAKRREHETSRRWQANFDLMHGRLMAMKVRCYEYNWACARLVKDTPKFQNPKSNTWRLVPDKTVRYSEKASEAGRRAEELLKRVVDEHPETPWALLATRELSAPFGFKWVEAYVPPPKPREDNANPARRKNANTPAPKPLEPPKL